MPGSRTLIALLVAGLVTASSARVTLSAQAPDPAVPASAGPPPSPTRLPHAAVAAATSADAVGAWTTRISTMLRDGRLDIGRVDDDTMLPGRTHERLVQRYNGLPVFGAEVVRQLSGSSVETIFGTVYDDVAAPTTPSITADRAAVAAAAAVSQQAHAAQAPVLGILPSSGGLQLAWRVDVRSPRDVRRVYVDALSGAVVRSDSQLRTQTVAGVVGIGTGVFGDSKKISADRGTNGFEARDVLRPAKIETYDLKGDVPAFESFLNTGALANSDIARDDDNTWTDGAVVDAHVYDGYTYDFYFKQFGRHGLDDHSLGMQFVVHPLLRAEADQFTDDTVDLFINNAAYVGGGQMFLGDGDGKSFTYFAGSLDVVAHEWSHGVTDYSSGLEYRDYSGALNESFSDIMGTSAEFFLAQLGATSKPADWLIGEDITLDPPGFIRSMANPILGGQPDHASLVEFIGTDIDNGGVHVNSGIPNHAFYLAVNGGQNRVSGIAVPGVGISNIDHIEKVFYRAFVFFLTPSANFSDARAATVQAAIELYGASSNERQQVELAWDAVGVR